MEDNDNSRMISDGSLGIFTVLAFILLLWGYMWFRGTGMVADCQTINIFFHEVAQLDNNAAVYVDGVRVGMVDKLDWLNEHRVLVRIKITTRQVVIPQGCTYTILTNGIVGAKYVDITMPQIPMIDAGLPPLPNNSEVRGQDPGRPELAINKLVITLSNIDPVRLQKNFEDDRKRLVRAADQLSILAMKTMPVIDAALPLEHDLSSIARDLKGTARKISRLLDDPNFSGDLKETATKLKETAESVQETVHDINNTLADKPLRRDLLSALERLSLATEHVQVSVSAVEKMSHDQKLRTDVKDILIQARSTLDKVDAMFSKPGYGSDLRLTLTSTRQAIGHLDRVAQQLNQILDKRAPLLHLMFGRPGKLGEPPTARELKKEKEKADRDREKKLDKIDEREEKREVKREEKREERKEQREESQEKAGLNKTSAPLVVEPVPLAVPVPAAEPIVAPAMPPALMPEPAVQLR